MRGLVPYGAGFLLAAVTLGGCSSSDGGSPATALPPTHSSADPTTVAPTTPTATSPRPTPKPTPSKPAKPTLPAIAKQDTAAGAEATAEYWFYAWSYAFETGRTESMKSVSAKGCEACSNFSAGIDGEIRKGFRYLSAPSRLESTHTSAFAATAAVVSIKFLGSPVRIYDPVKKKTSTNGTYRHAQLEVHVSRHAGRWTVEHVYLGLK